MDYIEERSAQKPGLFENQSFTKRQAKAILDDALRGQTKRIGYIGLQKVAEDVSVDQSNLDSAIKRFNDRRERIRKIIGITTTLGIIGSGLGLVTAKEIRKNLYANATVVEAGEFKPGSYRLDFKLSENPQVYHVAVSSCYGCANFRVMKEVIQKGSEIGIRRGAIDALQGLSGVVSSEDIKVLKH